MNEIISPSLINDYFEYRVTKDVPFGNETKKQTEYSVLSLNNFMILKYPTTSLTQIKPFHIRKFIKYLSIEKSLKASTINTRLQQLKSFFYFCVDNGIIDADPTTTIEAPDIPTSVATCITMQEFSKVISAIQNSSTSQSDEHRVSRDLVFMRLLAYTACSLEEICSLTVKDVDTENKTILFKGTNKSEPRKLLLPDMLNELILDYKTYHLSYYHRSASKIANAFFQCSHATLQRIVNKFSMEALGIKLNIDDIKASRIRAMITSDVSLWAVADFLGVYDLTRLKRYIPDYKHDLRSDIELIKNESIIFPEESCYYLKGINKRHNNRNLRRL